jgi:NAD(P)H-flavin reductase
MSMAPRPDVAPADPGAVDPMVPRMARVRRRWRDGPQVWTFELEPEATKVELFEPGQFNMLTAFGVGEVPVSLSGDPAEPGRLIHTIRAVGPVSAALTRLAPGDVIGLRGPFGRGWPMAAAVGRDVVIVAGGLGLAPLRGALYRLLAERGRYGKIALLYGTRSPDEILFRREIEGWRRRLDIDIEVTVDHAVGDWHGQVGVVTTLIPRAAFDPPHAIALVCGPEVMMRFAIAALRDARVAEDAIYLSMERNMKCAIGFCGHCQFGPVFVCRDGPVFPYGRVRSLLGLKEI